ncbi:MAG: hypothetical protein E6Q36_01370 [Chryseobacterium sp.]|nr:MAG: hypothetical protein E6Q36_01370 [Chryseobacterium sp.]
MPEDKKPAAKSGDSNDKLMGVLAYLGFLVLVPLLAAKDSKFAQYHAKQGITLFAAEIVLMVLYWVAGFAAVFTGGFGFILFPLLGLVWLGLVVLSIIGIINAVNGEEKPLPIIGGIQLMK